MRKRRLFAYILMVCCCLADVIAQTQKVIGQIIDEDYNPVQNATVKVKGTNLTTTTDKDGNYVFEEVPLILDTLEAEKGRRKNRGIEVPMKIKMRTQVMDRFSWFIKAGIGTSQFIGADYTMFSEENPEGNLTYYGGAGIDIRLGRHWSFQTAVILSYTKLLDRGYDYNTSSYYKRKISHDPLSLEFPLLFALKFKIANRTNLVFDLGPYVSLGISGEQKYYVYDSSYKNDVLHTVDLYGRRFTGGGIAGVGVEIRDHYLIGTSFKIGATCMDHGESYMTFSFELGYKF